MASGLRREGAGLIVCHLVSKISILCDSDPRTFQTEGQMTCNLNTAFCNIMHRALRGNKSLKQL